MNCVYLFKIYLKQMEGSVSETRCVPGGLLPPGTSSSPSLFVGLCDEIDSDIAFRATKEDR